MTILDDVDFRIDKAQVDFLLSNHAEGEYVQARRFQHLAAIDHDEPVLSFLYLANILLDFLILRSLLRPMMGSARALRVLVDENAGQLQHHPR